MQGWRSRQLETLDLNPNLRVQKLGSADLDLRLSYRPVFGQTMISCNTIGTWFARKGISVVRYCRVSFLNTSVLARMALMFGRGNSCVEVFSGVNRPPRQSTAALWTAGVAWGASMQVVT